jgi:hypothetical protein
MPTISLTRLRFPGLAALIAAPAALLLTPGRAEAILTYNIFDSGPNQVTLQASGSITLNSPASFVSCGTNGKFQANIASFCTGPNAFVPTYSVTGPTSLPITPGFAVGNKCVWNHYRIDWDWPSICN